MSAPVQGTLDGLTPEILPASKSRPGEGKRRGKGRFRSTLDKALRSRWQEAFAWLMEGVAGKDPTCTRIYWERVMPAPRRMAIEITTADNKPLRVETPADARTAMAEVLSMVASGELASDEAEELITAYGKYLAASSIHTLSPGDTEAIAGEDPRKLLTEKLARILEARTAVPPAEEAEPAAAPEVNEDELTERILEALARKLEDS